MMGGGGACAVQTQGFPILGKKGLQRAASPLPEREVSSHPPFLPAAAGGTKQNWKALVQTLVVLRTRFFYGTVVSSHSYSRRKVSLYLKVSMGFLQEVIDELI
jgi:hypothetical protein